MIFLRINHCPIHEICEHSHHMLGILCMHAFNAIFVPLLILFRKYH